MQRIRAETLSNPNERRTDVTGNRKGKTIGLDTGPQAGAKRNRATVPAPHGARVFRPRDNLRVRVLRRARPGSQCRCAIPPFHHRPHRVSVRSLFRRKPSTITITKRPDRERELPAGPNTATYYGGFHVYVNGIGKRRTSQWVSGCRCSIQGRLCLLRFADNARSAGCCDKAICQWPVALGSC